MTGHDRVRCPACGALAAAGAEWCGQCYASLLPSKPPSREPAIHPGSGAEGSPGQRYNGNGHAPVPVATLAPPPYPFANEAPAAPLGDDTTSVQRATWPCAVCGHANDLDLDACEACTAPFARLFDDPRKARRRVDPRTAAMWSLALPGAGHWLAGRAGEAVGRAILFLWCAAAGASIILSHPGGGLAAVGFMGLLFLLAVAVVYVVSAVDAYRAAQDTPGILSPRWLMYGTIGAFVLSGATLLITMARVTGHPR